MIYSDDVLSRSVVAVLSLCGFLVARHIYKHKKPENTPLVCPANFDCDGVVHSDYSKFFGIHLEVFGMIYYLLVFFGYSFLVFSPEVLPIDLLIILFLSSLGAFLFSLYLVGIQLFVLKKGCLWCFVSAFVSISIFILNVFAYDLVKMMQTFIK